MKELPSVEQLLENGLHFGHKRARRHPKMEPFLFTTKNDLTIIDVRLTRQALARACEVAAQVGKSGGTLLFVGTKKQAAQAIKKYAEGCGQPFVIHRWLGGTLTNFSVISKMIKKYHTLKGNRESGEFQKYTKKEQLDRSREIDELEHLIGGIQNLAALPDMLFIIDISHDDTAVKEAQRKGIPVIALCDANTNPERVSHPIPGNDDARKGIELIIRLIAEAYMEGKAAAAEGKTIASEKTVDARAPSEGVQPVTQSIEI